VIDWSRISTILSCINRQKGIIMRNTRRYIAIIATGLTATAALLYTTLAQPPQVPALPTPATALLQNYQPVTEERLKNPEPGNWLMIRRTYDGWGYSTLNQINTGNVSKLKPVWGILTGETKVHEAAPIVNNGVMFVSTPTNQVMALNAKTGDLLWTYRRPRPQGLAPASMAAQAEPATYAAQPDMRWPRRSERESSNVPACSDQSRSRSSRRRRTATRARCSMPNGSAKPAL